MKKRNIALLVLTVALVGGTFTGCGSETVPSDGINPQTKQKVRIEAKVVPTFKAGRTLKDAVR